MASEAKGKGKKRAAPSGVFSRHLFEKETIARHKAAFDKETPFKHLRIPNLLNDESVRAVREELVHMDANRRQNDLYAFYQTNDFKSLDTAKYPNAAALRDQLYGEEFREMMSGITGIEFKGTVDLACLVFGEGDHLLCHDDDNDARRVAYIIYLVPEDWSAEDGGGLDLFDMRSEVEPGKVVKTLVPQWNSLAFFEVTKDSYHAVAEVLASDKLRLSISGWLHGKPNPRPKVPHDAPLEYTPLCSSDVDLSKWINPLYLSADTHGQIAGVFGEESSVNLVDFLLPERSAAIQAALRAVGGAKDGDAHTSDEGWTLSGPPNKHMFLELAGGDASGEAGKLLREASQMMQSDAFGALVSQLVDLEVTGVASRVRRFRRGQHYELLYDGAEATTYVLDANLCLLATADLGEDNGGMLVYSSTEVPDLITVEPQHNALSLALREEGVMRFVKFVPTKSLADRFEVDACFSVVVPDDSDSDSDGEEDKGEGAGAASAE